MTIVGTSGLVLNEKLLFEHSDPGRKGYSLPKLDVPAAKLPAELCREEISGFPELSEVDVVRHFTRLSTWNYGVDSGFYPLGSCTMKYNPKVNEAAARIPGLADIHPATPAHLAQGILELMYRLQVALAEVSGFARVTLQPAAGAQGELTGMLVIRAWHEARGSKRTKVLIPDTAHGTNPATAALTGYDVVPIASEGVLTLEEVEAHMDDDVAALMVTNPNTLGLFETNIEAICKLVHERGGLVYCDGANLNALMGIARPGDMGIDVMHFNLHKTFSTPHGGGGPGAGPVGVTEELIPYLPGPGVERDGDQYRFESANADSVGRLMAFHGNVGVMVRAYAYAQYGRFRLEARQRDGCAQCQLRAGQAGRRLRPAVQKPFAARGDLLRQGSRGWLSYPGCGQAPDRLRLSSADHLFPAGGQGRDHDRADRDREPGSPRRVL